MCSRFIRQKGEAFAIFKNKKDTLHLIVFAILGLLFCQYAYLSAIENSNSGTATVLQTLSVVMVPFFVCISKKKKPEVKEIFSIALALLGVFLIATHGNPSQMVLSKGGLFWGLCAALAAVFYSTLSERLVATWGSQIVTGFGMLIGGVAFTAIGRPWHFYVPLDKKGIFVLTPHYSDRHDHGIPLLFKGCQRDRPGQGAFDRSPGTCLRNGHFLFVAAYRFYQIADIIGFVCILATVVILTGSGNKEGNEAQA